MLVMRKQTNVSFFKWGFAISQEYQEEFQYHLSNGPLAIGETRKVTLKIYEQLFPVKLVNIRNQRIESGDHAKVIQVRYDNDANILPVLRATFHASWEYIARKHEMPNHIHKSQIKIPESLKEEFVIHSIGLDIFEMECIPCSDSQKGLLNSQAQAQGMEPFSDQEYSEIKEETANYQELQLELHDDKVEYGFGKTLKRVRKLDKSIGEILKRAYDYRCQVTGEKIGSQYNTNAVEVHHIIPFSESLNNDSTNLIVLSPNFHRIIHKTKPMFDRENLLFVFPNGVKEKVLIDKHLNVL